MIYDKIENLERYKGLPDIYEGLVFLKNATAETEKGKHLINSNVIANVSEVTTAETNPLDFEAHKEHLDIHFPLNGEERILVCPVENLVQYSEYNAETDAVFYKNPSAKTIEITVGNGYFAVLFPNDGHEPLLCVGKPEKMKKVVVKVKI